MVLHISGRSMTSDLTPEAAYYLPDPGGGGKWLLTWLPDRLLTREQAIDAMMLDELLSDPHGDGAAALRAAAVRAASLGMEVTEVVLRLAARIAERDRRRTDRPGRHRRHGPIQPRCTAPQRLFAGFLTVSAALTRLLYAVAALPLLSVLAALLTAWSR